MVQEEHERDLSDAPSLPSEAETEDDPVSKEAINYFLTRMTNPQRMMTFSHFWNVSDKDLRADYLRTLINIIDDIRISNKIKGGQEILDDIDIDHFPTVTYPRDWIDYFEDEDDDLKVAIFKKLYQCMEKTEQNHIIAGLCR